MTTPTGIPSSPWKHVNKLRWLSLSLVFSLLILLPYLHIYQNYYSAHAYDLLSPAEKSIYDAVEAITEPFVSDPSKDLNALKGTTWSGTLFGLRLSDPLALLGQVAASFKMHWPLLTAVLLPVAMTLLFGRFYCGWLCPATFLYEMADKTAAVLRKAGFPVGRESRRLNRNFKYLVLAVGVGASVAMGTVAFSAVYPPAIIGRELFYMIAYSGVGAGSAFFLMTVLFDLLLTRRGFCRYVCPGGALYALLGRYRLVRIQRLPERCDDCSLCNLECQFGLDPKRDGFGQDCNNCTACIAVCPTNALTVKLAFTDQPDQGPGHKGAAYRHRHPDAQKGGA